MENEYTIVTYDDDLKILSFLLESEKDSYKDKHYVKISKNKEKQLIEEQFCNAGSLYLKEIPESIEKPEFCFKLEKIKENSNHESISEQIADLEQQIQNLKKQIE